MLIAGATRAPDATRFTLRADAGTRTYGILENCYLAARATTRSFECSVTVHDDGSWSYEEDTVVVLDALGGRELHHTDRNHLTKVG